MNDILAYVIESRTLQKLTLSKSVDKNILRTVGRLLEIKGEVFLALESFYANGKTSQVNIPEKEAVDKVFELINNDYKQLNIMTTSGVCEVKVSKKGRITVINKIKKNSGKAVNLEHNRKKNYIIPDNSPVDFLIELGVSDENGRIFDKKRSKFKQINRFLETVSDVEESICKGNNLYILDLCCGKSYLSFAIYYYFAKLKGLNVTMDCVDLKEDVIEFCQNTAKKL